MNNKKLFIVSLIILTILTIGAVSAADDGLATSDGLTVDDSSVAVSTASAESDTYETNGDIVADYQSDSISNVTNDDNTKDDIIRSSPAKDNLLLDDEPGAENGDDEGNGDEDYPDEFSISVTGEYDVTDQDEVIVCIFVPDVEEGDEDIEGYFVVCLDDDGEIELGPFNHTITPDDYGTDVTFTASDLEITEPASYWVRIFHVSDLDEDLIDEEGEDGYNMIGDGVCVARDYTQFYVYIPEDGRISLFDTDAIYTVYCPPGSEGTVTLTLREEDGIESSIVKEIDDVDDENQLYWDLDDMGLDTMDAVGEYEVFVTLNDGTLLCEDKISIMSPIEISEVSYINSTDYGHANLVSLVKIPSEIDDDLEELIDGRVIIEIDGEKVFNMTLSEFVEGENYDFPFWVYTRYGWRDEDVDTRFKIYYVLNNQLDEDLEPGTYDVTVRLTLDGWDEVSSTEEVRLVKSNICVDEDIGVSIEIFDQEDIDLDDEERIIAITVTGDKGGRVNIAVIGDSEWGYSLDELDNDGDTYYIYSNNFELESGEYEVVVSYDLDGASVSNSAILNFVAYPRIFICGSGGEDLVSYFPDADDVIHIYPNGDNVSTIRIVVTIEDEIVLNSTIDDLGLSPKVNDWGETYYTVGPANFNKKLEFGHYEPVVAYYYSDAYEISTDEPSFIDIIGMVHVADIDDDETTVLAVCSDRDGTIALYIRQYTEDGNQELDPLYFEVDKYDLIMLTLDELGLDEGQYHIDVAYLDDEWIFGDDLIVVNSSEYFVLYGCDWLYTEESVVYVWCPDDAEGIISLTNNDETINIDYEITDEDKGKYVEFTLEDLGITEPGWYEISIRVNGNELEYIGLDVPSPINMPTYNVYLPEEGYEPDYSMIIARLDLTAGLEGHIIVSIDGNIVFLKDIADMEPIVDGSKWTYTVYTSDLDEAEEGMHDVTVTFNDLGDERFIEFRNRVSNSLDDLSIIMLGGTYCINWDDVIAEVIAPFDYNGRLVLRLEDEEVESWDELHWVNCDNYNDTHNVYYVYVSNLHLEELGDYTVSLDYYANRDDDEPFRNTDDYTFVGDDAFDVQVNDHNDLDLIAMNDWIFQISPNDHPGYVILYLGDEDVLRSDVYELDTDEWGNYIITPDDAELDVGYYGDISLGFYAEDGSYQIHKISHGYLIISGDFEYWASDVETLRNVEWNDAFHVNYDESIDEGQIVLTVRPMGSDETVRFPQDVNDDYYNFWKCAEVGINALGTYVLNAYYENGDYSEPIMIDHILTVRALEVRHVTDVDIDYPSTVLNVYNANEFTKVYVNGQEAGPGNNMSFGKEWYPIVWDLDDLEIFTTGKYNISVVAYDADDEVIEDYNFTLFVHDVADLEDYRLIMYQDHDWDYFSPHTPAAYLYCPEGSEGAITIEVYGPEDSNNFLYTIDDEITEDDIGTFKSWTLPDLEIDEQGWHYRIIIKDAEGVIIADSGEFGAMIYYDDYTIVSIELYYDDEFSSVIASLSDQYGYPFETDELYVSINDEEAIAVSTNGLGMATIPISGNASVYAYYENDDESISYDKLEVYVIEDIVYIGPVAYIELERDGNNIIITLSDDEGPISEAILNVYVNDIETLVDLTDEEGQTVVSFEGNATIEVIYIDENDIAVSNSIEIINDTVEVEKIVLPNATIALSIVDGAVIANVTDVDGAPLADKLLTVTVNGAPKLGAKTDSNGIYSIDVEGNATVVVSCSDANGIIVSSSIEVVNNVEEVEKLVLPNATIALSIVDGAVIANVTDVDGAPLADKLLTVTVNGAPKLGAKTDANGIYSIDVEGNATVVVSCSDANGIIVSSSIEVVNNVEEVEKLVLPNATIALDIVDSTVIANVTDVDGAPLADKMLVVTVNGVPKLGAKTDANGIYSIDVEGNATVVVSCTDANGITVSSTIKVINNTEEVEKIVYVPVVSNSSFSIDGDENGINASLVDADGKPIAGALVEIDADGAKSNKTTDANGNIEIPMDTNSSVTLTYTDENGAKLIYTAKVITNTVIVEVPVIPNRTATKVIYKNMTTTAFDSNIEGRIGKYFEVTLTDDKGNPLANKTVYIGFNGKVYERQTNDTGGAKLQINLGYKGGYTFAVAFLGDDNYTGSLVVAIINVNLQSPKLTTAAKTYKVSAKTKVLNATFKSAYGTPISGKKISFTLNGKTYSATTDSKGVATVKVSLSKKGTYRFTAQFAGDSTYKATSVSSKLTLK